MRRMDLERSDMEILWVEVRLKKSKILVGNAYRPPNSRVEWMDNLNEMLLGVVGESAKVMMLGDFNCDFLKSNFMTQRLEDVMSGCGLQRHSTGATRVTEQSETEIDVLFTMDVDGRSILQHAGVSELGLSDHSLVYGVVKGDADRKMVR